MEQNQKYYLFQLIKSLSTAEKGYVKKHSKKTVNNPSYIKLLEAIDRQDTYDEQRLKKKFRNEKWVKQFSVAKNYLIKVILKNLRAFNAESSNNFRVHELLLEIELLYKKRMIGLCERLLHRCKKIVLDCQLFHHAEELAYWEFKLTVLSPYNKVMDQKMKAINRFALDGLDAARLLSAYRHLAYEVHRYTFKDGYSRAETSIQVAHEFSQHPLLIKPPPQSNVKALGRYWNTWHKVHEINTDFVQGYKASKALVELIQRNPKVFGDTIMSTIIPAYYNLLACAIVLNQEIIFFNHLAKLQQIPEFYQNNSRSVQKLSYFYSVTLELQFYTHNGHFDLCDAVLEKAVNIIENEDLKNFGLAIYHIELCYCIAYAYFGKGAYQASDDWVLKTLENEKENIRQDLICMAHLLHLVNHAELGAFRYLDYKLRNSYNFIKKMEKIHRFERIALEFLRKLIYLKDSSEFIKLVKIYLQKFRALENDPFERMILMNFDIISYLESKLKGQVFVRIAKSRRHAKNLALDQIGDFWTMPKTNIKP